MKKVSTGEMRYVLGGEFARAEGKGKDRQRWHCVLQEVPVKNGLSNFSASLPLVIRCYSILTVEE